MAHQPDAAQVLLLQEAFQGARRIHQADAAPVVVGTIAGKGRAVDRMAELANVFRRGLELRSRMPCAMDQDVGVAHTNLPVDVEIDDTQAAIVAARAASRLSSRYPRGQKTSENGPRPGRNAHMGLLSQLGLKPTPAMAGHAGGGGSAGTHDAPSKVPGQAPPAQAKAKSPEMTSLVARFQELMGRIKALEASKAPDAGALKKATIAAGNLSTSPKGIVDANAALDRVEAQIADAKRKLTEHSPARRLRRTARRRTGRSWRARPASA